MTPSTNRPLRPDELRALVAHGIDAADGNGARILRPKTVITRPELERLTRCRRRDDAEILADAGVPSLIAHIALAEPVVDIPSSWAWVRDDSPDRAAARATAMALAACATCTHGTGILYTSVAALAESWTSADLYGANSRSHVLTPCRRAGILIIAGIGSIASRYDAEILEGILNPRRLEERPTYIAATVDGRRYRAVLRSAGNPAAPVDALMSTISRALTAKGSK